VNINTGFDKSLHSIDDFVGQRRLSGGGGPSYDYHFVVVYKHPKP
jgi:hypothetical protein